MKLITQRLKPNSAEEKILIVSEDLRDEECLAKLCRRDTISQGIYLKGAKNFLEAGKKRLA